MANYTQGDTRVVLHPSDLATYQGNGSAVLDSRRTRPLWFDGRFLAARDLEREQNYFLLRQADLGRAPGFGVINGLSVTTVSPSGSAVDRDAIVIAAGQGVTPAGEFVAIPSDLTLRISDLAEEQGLDLQFGISNIPAKPAAARTGLYAIALRPVQYTANPIAAYPTTVQGAMATHNGDIVEATAVSLIPWPVPASNYSASTLNAALARQMFVTGNPAQPSDSVLPLAIVNMNGGAIDWLDPWLVRREAASRSTLGFGLTDPASQQAFLLQYDLQLQQAINTLVGQNLPARFPATSYFQALPPVGRFPLASIDANGFTQTFFPPQMDVRLSVVPDDELAALIHDAMSLPPIDLALPASTFANMTVFALIPTPRQGFAGLEAGLPAVPTTSVLPQVLNNRRPLDLLRFYQGSTGVTTASATDNSSWQGTIRTQTYGYFIRRRSSPTPVAFTTPPPPPTTTAAPTTTTTSTTTSTTVKPTTTTTTTTAKPTTTTTTTAPPTTTTTTTAKPTTTTTTTAKPTTTTTTTTTPPPTTTTTTTTAKPTTTTTTTTAKPKTTTTTVKPTTTTARITLR